MNQHLDPKFVMNTAFSWMDKPQQVVPPCGGRVEGKLKTGCDSF